MSAKAIEPSGGDLSKVVKNLVSALYILTPLAIYTYRMSMGQTPDSIIILLVIIFSFASAYVVFGEKTVDSATETAQEVTGNGSEDE